jgi:hypothetical protein
MKKKLYFMLIIGMIFSSCENDSDNVKPEFQLESPSQLTDLEYEIYSLILDKDFNNSDLTIYQKTSINNIENQDDSIKSNELLNIEDSTIENYYYLNSNEYILDNRIAFNNGNISMISSNEYDYFFNDEDDNQNWKNFYKYYPTSFGIIQFSRIGFNNDFTQAIVNYSRNDINGNGTFNIYCLTKTNGNWEIQIYEIIISN